MDAVDRSFPKEHAIAAFALAGISIHLVIRYGVAHDGGLPYPITHRDVPLVAVLVLGGLPLLWDLVRDVWRRDFRADFLAGLSIITAIVLDEYLAGALVVLMLAGGKALESYAVRSALSTTV